MKYSRIWARVAIYSALGAIAFLIYPRTASTADGPSPEHREAILTAYFDALREKRVERPASKLEASRIGGRYSDSLYRPAVEIYGYNLRVHISKNEVVSYTVDYRILAQGFGEYAFRETGREVYDDMGGLIKKTKK